VAQPADAGAFKVVPDKEIRQAQSLSKVRQVQLTCRAVHAALGLFLQLLKYRNLALGLRAEGY